MEGSKFMDMLPMWTGSPLPLYSPKSAPALCIETSDDKFRLTNDDAASEQELRHRLSQCFMTDFEESMIEEVFREIREHGVSVVMLEPYWSDRIDYVTSFPLYKDLFEMTDNKWVSFATRFCRGRFHLHL